MRYVVALLVLLFASLPVRAQDLTAQEALTLKVIPYQLRGVTIRYFTYASVATQTYYTCEKYPVFLRYVLKSLGEVEETSQWLHEHYIKHPDNAFGFTTEQVAVMAKVSEAQSVALAQEISQDIVTDKKGTGLKGWCEAKGTETFRRAHEKLFGPKWTEFIRMKKEWTQINDSLVDLALKAM